MSRDRDLERRLRELRAPDEPDAEERSWEVVRAAYEDRELLPPGRRTRRLAVALAGGAAVLAIGLSPAGAKVGDLVSDVFSPNEGAPNAKPALRSLPAPGELLVESAQGPWIVHEDGSKRLLGDYDAATWSPHGLFVAAADGRELVAVDPAGEVRWTYPAPGHVSRPAWSICCDGPPPDQRIAYLSGADLHVIDADGSDDRLIARDVAPVTPGWRPDAHVLSYVLPSAAIRTVDVDTGERLQSTRADAERITEPQSGAGANVARSPSGDSLAIIREGKQGSELVLAIDDGTKRELFTARGRLTGPTWSPDGRWLLVGWPEADQWLFISVDRPHRVVPFARISEQFDPGGEDRARFPRVAGWILPER